MAELVIGTKDRGSHNARLLGEHEVICVCEDGWQWSAVERTNPNWRIVRVPGMSVSEANRWLADESVDADVYVKRQRHFKLDPSKMGKHKAWYLDDTRAESIREIPAAEFEKMFRTRTPMLRRDVIGEPPVIG